MQNGFDNEGTILTEYFFFFLNSFNISNIKPLNYSGSPTSKSFWKYIILAHESKAALMLESEYGSQEVKRKSTPFPASRKESWMWETRQFHLYVLDYPSLGFCLAQADYQGQTQAIYLHYLYGIWTKSCLAYLLCINLRSSHISWAA